MKKKVSEYIADFLADHGVDTVFTVTGGGAMHLNDAFGHHDRLKCVYNHHEQAASMAAEGYTRLSGKMTAVCVTSGPGGTNAVTGIFDCWVDSVPLFVVTGQVKRETTIWSSPVSLRQLGDQEGNIVEIVRPITKSSVILLNPMEIRYELERAWYLATHGRKGPVLIDVPLDVQGAVIETDDLAGFDTTNIQHKIQPVFKYSDVDLAINKIREAKRPLILAGEGIRLGDAYNEFIEAMNSLKLPVVTSWNAQDLLWEDSPYYVGIPGTVGQRGANFAVQNADLLLVLGCRMNIRTISYNEHQFAGAAYKIQVDIDENELKKPTVNIDLPIHADVKDVCRELALVSPEEAGDHNAWLKWCKGVQKRYPVILPKHMEKKKPMNPYPFLGLFCDMLDKDDTIICGNGAACVQTFQAFKLKKGMRVFTNSGSAAMGFGFPAALGAAVSRKGKRVICVDGDGSFMLNLQELETLVYNKLNVKIVILNNNGYHSIRQTQLNLMKGRPLVGVSPDNGVGFPDFEKLSAAFGLPYLRLDDLDKAEDTIKEFLNMDGAAMLEAILDPEQFFEPKLSSKVHPDGSITSSALDDMYPFLPEEEYAAIREEARLI